MMSDRTVTLLETDFSSWDAKKIADYLSQNGLGDYSELFESNNVTGSIAHLIDREKLKNMGVNKVGDRLRILQLLGSLKAAKKQQKEEEILWKGKEALYASCCEAIYETCCGLFPRTPSEYSLHANHLAIKEVTVPRCGPIRCCCLSGGYFIDNIDLSNVTDIDVQGIKPGCICQVFCCVKNLENIIVKVECQKDRVMVQHEGKGQIVSTKIKNQVEIMQRMERS